MTSEKLRRVLVVDDEADIRDLVALALRRDGQLTVETCGDARRAVSRAEAFGPQLILLDVMMPGLDGTAVLAELKSRPPLDEIPVVFLTAKAQPDEVARYRALGAFEVIRKPFNAMKLPATLARLWDAWNEPSDAP